MADKYGGELIYSSHDDYGPIEVVDFKNTLRSLHFGNATQQTGMLLINPVVLIHNYAQAMLTPLCWHAPKRILVLGLGAGAIPKYLLHFLPECTIDVVELRPEVVKVAEQFFNLNLNHERLNINYLSAEKYLEKISNENKNHKYDLIIIDIFLTDNEKDITIDIGSHVKTLKNILSDKGHISLNIIGCEYLNYSGLKEFQDAFTDQLFIIPVDASNIILLAGHNIITNENDINFTSTEKNYGLNFKQYFKQMSPI